MTAKRILFLFLVIGFVTPVASSDLEAAWWDWLFKAEPEAPKSLEERARKVGDVGIRSGQEAPDFELAGLGGGTVRLSSYRGDKAVLLNFWATWCFPCRKEMPSLEALSKSFEQEGLVVLGVNIDVDGQESGSAAAFVRETGVTFPIAFDPKSRVAEKYAVHGIPVTYFISREGLILKRVFGDRDWTSPDVRALVKRLLLDRNSPKN